jgi:hypothetical protein
MEHPGSNDLDLQHKMESQALEKYGSFEEPNFAFEIEAIERDPYASIRSAISEWFEVEDWTADDDMSFRFRLTSQNDLWEIRISMIGPYATFERHDESHWDLITSSSAALNEKEKSAVCLLESNGLLLLWPSILERPARLKTFNCEPEDVAVYQMLFVDNEFLPWRGTILSKINAPDNPLSSDIKQ